MLFGQIQSTLLMAGVELGVFSHLCEPASAIAVAEAIDGYSVNTGVFLNGLAAIGLVRKKAGLCQNSPLAQAYLVPDTETCMGRELISVMQMQQPVLDDIAGLVREGPRPIPETDIASEEFWTRMARDMANSERGGTAQQVAGIVSALPEFPAFRKMLDLGGGPGLIGMAIVAEHPSLKGVVFDRPQVVKVAEELIKEYEMEDRMEVLGGDYLQDSIGEGYDLIWASACLNFAKHDMDSLMKKIYDALSPNGVFISCAEGLTHERTLPEIRVLESLLRALVGQDFWFDQGFIADSMLRAGFRSVRSSTLDSCWGPMDLDVARK
jgi:hypothetical protein